ncbi:MAG: molybdopterin dinucleotide binding domain-containing protein [Planctomycetaceae bacterium]
MPEQFILIPGRTSRQGTTLNEGKSTDGYKDETTTMQVNPDDMLRLGLSEGDRVRMWNDVGHVTVPIKASKGDELPAGMLFISYGDISSRLMGLDTHGSGMPDSKGLDVWLEPARSEAASRDAPPGN